MNDASAIQTFGVISSAGVLCGTSFVENQLGVTSFRTRGRLRDVDACSGARDDDACAGDDWGPESAGGACRARWCAHAAGVDCACAGATTEGEARCVSCVAARTRSRGARAHTETTTPAP